MIVILVLVVAIIGVILSSGIPTTPSKIVGVVTYNNLKRDHSSTPQNYSQSPPVGGVHSLVLQNCGVYDKPVSNENAVHSMEVGAVWITYQPNLVSSNIEQLRRLARKYVYVLLSPYLDLPSPIVVSAWGAQLKLSDVNDIRLTQFLSRYIKEPQTLKPGELCSGGIGNPL